MNIKKLPLSERIKRLRTGHPAHEEYYASIICETAHTPIAAYAPPGRLAGQTPVTCSLRRSACGPNLGRSAQSPISTQTWAVDVLFPHKGQLRWPRVMN